MEFILPLDPHGSTSLQQQLCEQLRRAILMGHLLPGQRIPSTRSLAQTLGISRTTIVQSYEQLLSEGYLDSQHGSGTFVCQQLPEDFLHSLQQTTCSNDTTCNSGNEYQQQTLKARISAFGTSLLDAQPFEPSVPSVPIRFRFGQPDLEHIPLKQWQKLWLRHCRLGHQDVFDYAPDSLGYLPLREAIVQYLIRTRGLQCDADQVIIVNDPLQAVDLVSRVLIDREDRIALENPGFLDIRRIFLAYGAEVCPIPVDNSGIKVENIFNLTENRMKLVYVTPSHQFPLGVTLSLSRRLELLAWAKASNTIILEEDYDSEFRYSGHPIPSLQGLDPTAPVIYVGSFLEVLFPGLRLGYLVAPHSLIHVLARAKWLAARQAPLLEQCVLTDFLLEGHLERHIRRMRVLYSKRRQTLEKALAKVFDQRMTILGEPAGTHLTVRLKSLSSDFEVLARAASVGVGLMSTKPFYLQDYPGDEYLLGYTDLPESDIQSGIDLLSNVLDFTNG